MGPVCFRVFDLLKVFFPFNFETATLMNYLKEALHLNYFIADVDDSRRRDHLTVNEITLMYLKTKG